VPRCRPARAAFVLLALPLILVAAPAAASDDAPPDAVICHEGSLAHQRTEIDADITVAGFDPALGALLEVEVPVQSVHLDTDAVFENTAQSAAKFEEHMTYQLTFTSPGGLASPPMVAGSVERVPSQTLAAFDGTLDFLGASAVTQPSIAWDAAADPVASSDPSVLASFSVASVAFHVTSSIGETFLGGGGNIEAKINTFAAATVRVCYRYALPTPPSSPPTTAPPSPTTAPPVAVEATAVTLPRALAFTGRADGWLAASGAGVLGLGVALLASARRDQRRGSRHTIDLGGVDA